MTLAAGNHSRSRLLSTGEIPAIPHGSSGALRHRLDAYNEYHAAAGLASDDNLMLADGRNQNGAVILDGARQAMNGLIRWQLENVSRFGAGFDHFIRRRKRILRAAEQSGIA